jgi:hypothetical protein
VNLAGIIAPDDYELNLSEAICCALSMRNVNAKPNCNPSTLNTKERELVVVGLFSFDFGSLCKVRLVTNLLLCACRAYQMKLSKPSLPCLFCETKSKCKSKIHKLLGSEFTTTT